MMSTLGPIPLPLHVTEPGTPDRANFDRGDNGGDFAFDDAFMVPETDENDILDFTDLLAGFEDPFLSPFLAQDVPAEKSDQHEPPSSGDVVEKLLAFSAPKSFVTLVDSAGRHFNPDSMKGEICGMFFVAEDPFEEPNLSRPQELTCYRRNLWQCVCEITLPKDVTYFVDKKGKKVAASELRACLKAEESIEGKPAQIIEIPWRAMEKTLGTDSRSETTPTAFPIDLSNGQVDELGRVTSKIVWKRLQFKYATANNGRRKGLQQCYTVKIQLQGKTQSGEWTRISEVQSSPIIVRGRSPRNFDRRKDVPLTGETRGGKRTSHSPMASPKRAPNASEQPGSWILSELSEETGAINPPLKRRATSPNVSRRHRNSRLNDETSSKRRHSLAVETAKSQSSSHKPVPLRLFEEADDEESSAKTTAEPQSAEPPPPVTGVLYQSPAMEEDELYEYFPLSISDWMPPVETAYIPHAAHLTHLPAQFQAEEERNKNARYFVVDSSQGRCPCK